jgi:hypothetical protein
LDARERASADVEDFLQRVDVRIDEQASIDFDCGISAEVKRIAAVLLGRRELVIDMKLPEEASN